MVPVVLGQVTPVLHRPPAGPSTDGVLRGVPDLLTPDDVLEVERRAVVPGTSQLVSASYVAMD